MLWASVEDAYVDVWGKRFQTTTAVTIPGTAGSDGVINSANGLGGPAPCLENYILVAESSTVGGDPHLVHGIWANDGAYIGVGSSDQAGTGFDNGSGKDGIVFKGSSGCTHTNKYSTYTATASGATAACENWSWVTLLNKANKVTKANWIVESPDNTYFIVVGIEEDDSVAYGRSAIWKINAADGATVWKWIYSDGVTTS